MYRLFLTLGLALGLVTTTAVLPAFAQNANKSAKKLGQKGIYGRNTTDVTEENDTKEEEQVEETEEERKLKAKYPLSITNQTLANRRAHEFALKGMKHYYATRKLFDQINKVTSEYDEATKLLTVTQGGAIKSRLQPRDLLEYGAEHAYIGLRMRAIQNEALKEVNLAISNFAQAKGIAPSVASLQKWYKVSVDTKKVLNYHLKFYKVTIKAMRLGMTQEQLDQLAKLWAFNVNPKGKNIASIKTMVRTDFLKILKAKDGEAKESISYESVADNLPNLDFKIINF